MIIGWVELASIRSVLILALAWHRKDCFLFLPSLFFSCAISFTCNYGFSLIIHGKHSFASCILTGAGSGSGLSTGAIVGIVIGVLLLLLVAGSFTSLLVWCYCCRDPLPPSLPPHPQSGSLSSSPPASTTSPSENLVYADVDHGRGGGGNRSRPPQQQQQPGVEYSAVTYGQMSGGLTYALIDHDTRNNKAR